MCNGFGCIITKDLTIHTVFPPRDNGDIHHSSILNVLRWEDSSTHMRRWIRIECDSYDMDCFKVDEEDTLPGWAQDEDGNVLPEIMDAVEKFMHRYTILMAGYIKENSEAYLKYVSSSDNYDDWKNTIIPPILDKYMKKLEAIRGGVVHLLPDGIGRATMFTRGDVSYITKDLPGVKKALRREKARKQAKKGKVTK